MTARPPGISLLLETVAKHVFTAADGETYAVGRMLGVLLLLFGIFTPGVGVLYIAATTAVVMADLTSFLSAMTLYVPALSGAVVMLITLTNPTEPKTPAASSITQTTKTVVVEPRPDLDIPPMPGDAPKPDPNK